MSRRVSRYVDVDYTPHPSGDEISLVIRTSDGSKLSPQDLLDAAVDVAHEMFGVVVAPVSSKDIKSNKDIH